MNMTKTVFHYHPHTGAYLCAEELDESDLSPVDLANCEHVWLIPAHCLEVGPPDIPEGKLAVARNGAWELIDAPQAMVDEAPANAEHIVFGGTTWGM